jgi:predicted XRE-type DNA-binding protein
MKQESPMAKSAREDNRIVASSGNVFADLGFDSAEARLLAMRTDLMIELEKQIKALGMTQIQAAEMRGVSQGRVSDLVRSKVDKFSLDMLVTFADKLGRPVQIKLTA